MQKRARFEAAVWAIVIVGTAALIWSAGLNPAAFAQQAQTAGIVTFRLFTGDSVDINPKSAQRLVDAARKAQAPGECPLGRLTIRAVKGDPDFQISLARARRDAVLQYLNSQGIDVSRFIADVTVGGIEGQDDVRLDLNAARDDIPPTLDVTWTPPKGTKVKAGSKITAKAVARDDANRWQTGINTIDLDVQGGGSFGFHDYPRPQPPCANPPPPRTLEGTYIVPANPPPIVRLRALTKDFAGHEARDIAEFPTGDWVGQIIWSMFADDGVGHHGTIDIAVSYDDRGNLTGRAVGTEQIAVGGNPCEIIFSTPPRMSAKVVGQYTPGANTMSLQFAEREETMGMHHLSCAPNFKPPSSYYPVAYGVGLGGVLNNLIVSATGSVDAERVRPQGHTTLRLSLKLRKVQN